MRHIRDLSEEEMIDAFVEAELESTRHGAAYSDLVFGDLTLYEGSCRHAKALRRIALSLIRGYGRGGYLFKGFPKDASWKLVAVPVSELGSWLYAHENTWLALSNRSRVLRDGAANVGTVPAVKETSDIILAVERDVRNGKTYPPIIGGAVSESAPHILAEGHTRATAYVRALDPENEVEVIVGYSPALTTWQYYGHP
jgi:hypothetical protein